MSRVVKTQIKMPTGVNSRDVSDLFNQMLGADKPQLTIAYPRYSRIKEIIGKIIRILDMFNQSNFICASNEYTTYRAEINIFTTSAKQLFEKYFNIDFSAYELNLEAVPDCLKAEFGEKYADIKKSDFVNTIIIMCDRLCVYGRFLKNINELDGKFISNIPGVTYEPFPFSTFNLKQVYAADGTSDNSKQFILLVLHKLYTFSKALYEEITQPDVNVEDIANIVLANMEQVRNIPELSRCRRAFDKITEAVDLLRTNFKDYYRDFISNKSTTTMMENFILDVSKNTHADVEIRREFMTIVKYYREHGGTAKKDPRVDMLFENINSTISSLERNTTNLVNLKQYE